MSVDKTPEEMRAYIEGAPMPCEGDKPWDRMSGEDGYELAALCAARAMLITVEEKREEGVDLLDLSQEKADDPTGWDAASNQKLWKATQDRFDGLNDWLGGITGFQFGWAHNAVRYSLEADPAGNPAIVTVNGS